MVKIKFHDEYRINKKEPFVDKVKNIKNKNLNRFSILTIASSRVTGYIHYDKGKDYIKINKKELKNMLKNKNIEKIE